MLLRVNMKEGKITDEQLNNELQRIGGRALTSHVVSQEVNPNCDPLSGENKIIFAVGPFAGTNLTCSGRLSIGAKSPLTGGIKESNAGGTTGHKIARLGYRGIIVEEKPEKGLYNLVIDKDGARLEDAEECRGMNNYELSEKLLQKYPGSALITIGSAGEKELSTACIANLDMDDNPSRMNGRGGLGAVMGTKGLKAIIVNDEGCEREKLTEEYKNWVKELNKVVKEAPTTPTYRDYGTPAMVDVTNALGGLPTYNFSRGKFSEADKINGEYLRDIIEKRGGDGSPSHPCMPGCIIRCSNIYPDEKGETIVAPLEYETIGLLGSNLGIGDLDKIAHLNYICNDVGVDTIEVGAAIGVMMDEDVCEFGDYEKAKELLQEIDKGSLIGRIIGSGALTTGQVFGSKRIPTVKGQSFAAYDPRSIKGLGVTYATSPMGADHTAGNTVRANVDHKDPEPQIDLSKKSQLLSTAIDALGICLFTVGGLGANQKSLVEALNARLGGEKSEEYLRELGEKILLLEKEFNNKAGYSEGADRLPHYMYEEVNPDSNVSFDVDSKKLDEFFDK
ncbi:aldehyde ferredoxin oxidoreductase C-terminal domain-containing protein [Natranaerofaba carboxydovora]|uniref:aldehyde ferredoxin oxidoreductase C-terminal domain-containing protein n=1 Tax=Natranaerofaba carboxydovora TaxID=2742683 RepID=UPI001F12FF44|nr:aldehyde ferredoxin oxidoreductase C-terminal domain-containing protein [Natranaerofaba carboxydovora]UMZ73761.1 putative oxidoreductase YdhV [Natranaerofaba carboxydovora]